MKFYFKSKIISIWCGDQQKMVFIDKILRSVYINLMKFKQASVLNYLTLLFSDKILCHLDTLQFLKIFKIWSNHEHLSKNVIEKLYIYSHRGSFGASSYEENTKVHKKSSLLKRWLEWFDNDVNTKKRLIWSLLWNNTVRVPVTIKHARINHIERIIARFYCCSNTDEWFVFLFMINISMAHSRKNSFLLGMCWEWKSTDFGLGPNISIAAENLSYPHYSDRKGNLNYYAQRLIICRISV